MTNQLNFIKYLKRHQVDTTMLPSNGVDPDIIVVIPCYDEPDILDALRNLRQATIDGFVVEVIVVVNSGEITPEKIVEKNRETFDLLQKEAKQWEGSLILSPVFVESVRRKHAGVGYARKVGMDLAVQRFADTDNEQGIIASLDADTKVASNYFVEVFQAFQANPKLYGAIVKFEHELEGDFFSKEVYDAIIHYELHLRYVNQALKMSEYPYVTHTVGSAFAVSAYAYVKHGGMNRRQGGEDFYFLHKLFPHGDFVNLNSTAVYPSSRPSDRVPFGTGPQVNEFLSRQELLTYKLDSFLELKDFVKEVPRLYDENVEFSGAMGEFLKSIALDVHLEEIRKNSSSLDAFVKRFYTFFDAFKVVKFLNFVHQSAYVKADILGEARSLLELQSKQAPQNTKSLLELYRKIEGK